MEWPHSEPDVNEAVWKASERFSEIGAKVQEVSLPIFLDAPAIWLAIVFTSILGMVESGGDGYWHRGYYDTYAVETFSRFAQTSMAEISPFFKMELIAGNYLRKEYHNRYYCKAQNLRRLLTEKIDELLSRVDVIATPTTPTKPPKLGQSKTLKEQAESGVGLTQNTCPLNLSGHPALSVPCGVRATLPIGLQLIGRFWHEAELLRVAYNFEQTFDWRKS
jgi:amidase